MSTSTDQLKITFPLTEQELTDLVLVIDNHLTLELPTHAPQRLILLRRRLVAALNTATGRPHSEGLSPYIKPD